MRRWTLLLIPHDTEQPRSIAVSERAVRLAGSAVALVVLVAVVGIGALTALVTRGEAPRDALSAKGGKSSVVAPPAAEIDSLRATVQALTGTLETFHEADARLSAASGVPSADSVTLAAHSALQGTRATADSLLRHASTLTGKLDRLADSATSQRPPRRPTASPHPTPSPLAPPSSRLLVFPSSTWKSPPSAPPAPPRWRPRSTPSAWPRSPSRS